MNEEKMIAIPFEEYYELRRTYEQFNNFKYMREDLANYHALEKRVDFVQGELYRISNEIKELQKK